MYKLLIVDDEYYFRQALKVSLPWEELGFELAAEAKNGAEALALLDEIHPDVVLVDINMPIMDGMSFIEHANRRGHSAKFIVLTGHSEFAYAKQAVQLGVFHYVLKPIDEEELRGSLLEVKERIRRERSVKLELELLKRQAKENIPLLKERLLNEWLLGNSTAQSSATPERLQYLGIDLQASHHRVVIVDDDAADEPGTEEERQIRKLAIRDIAQTFMPNGSYASCHDLHDRFVIILGCAQDSDEAVESLLDAVRSAVHKTLGSTVTIGVGNRYAGLSSISVSYQEALFALKHRFVLGGNQVIQYATIAESGMKKSIFTLEKRRSLLMCMRIGSLSEAEEWLAAFFQEARSADAPSMEMLLVAGLEIVSTCMEFLAEMSMRLDHVYKNHPDMMQTIQQMNSLQELEDWVRALVLNVIHHVHGNKKSRARKVVEEVKAYIHQHYKDETLRIDDIARGVYMNYNHLCYLFKKETSMTINDYLTEFRIHKAKELFDQGEQVVQFVANQVGYADANYFGKCFKKYMGITPSQYVNNIQ